MKKPLNKGLLFAGLSLVLGAGMTGVLAHTATADDGPDDPVPTPSRTTSSSPSAQPQPTGRPCGYSADQQPGAGGRELVAIGLTDDQKLITFDVAKPASACTIGVVALGGNERLVGIDYRVQDGKLYGVGGAGGVYVLSTTDASASKVSQLGVALNGLLFGVDFNPAADRLRVVSDRGQNLRHNLNDGVTVADGNLTYPPATAVALGVTGAAYTNNDLSAETGTTLFDIDTTLDQVAVQSPANSGQLAATGKLGVDAGGQAGFDIYSVVRDGRTTQVKGFAVLQVGGRSTLYAVDVLTGAAGAQGDFTGRAVVDLALPLNQL